MKKMLIQITLAVATLTPGFVYAQPVQFVDQNLKACIEEALKIFDPTPSDMLNLTTLDARHCQITNLRGIQHATNLQSLRLSFNEITSASPLSDLINLTVLKINDNQISSISDLSRLDNLWHLDVHNNQIQNIAALAGLPNLEMLVLRGNDISSISALSGLDLLRELDIEENELSEISALSSLTKLTHLKLDDNYISDISALSGLENLRFLGLSNNNISSITPLTSLTQLKSVDLRNNNLNSQAYNRDLQILRSNNPGVTLMYDPRSQPSEPVLFLSSTAGGEVMSSLDVSSLQLGDVVEITAEPVDTNLFTFETWSGSAVDNGNVLDPTDPSIRLELNEVQGLKAHFVTRLNTLYVASDVNVDVEPDLLPVLGTPQQPFHRIQDAIDVSRHGVTILVQQGTYTENLMLHGYDIVLTGIDFPVLQGGGTAPLVSFVGGEDANCVLDGLCLTMGQDEIASAVYCDNSHPTIANCLIVGNQIADSDTDIRGGAVYGIESQLSLVNCTIADNLSGSLGAGVTLVDSDATIINTIIWGNEPQDIRLMGNSSPSIVYSDVPADESGIGSGPTGPGNVSLDPKFVRSGQWTHPPTEADMVWTGGDYHLRSESGRWDPDTETWILDNETSLCIDGGDPGWPVSDEPAPNGDRVNMGAYGGTAEAAKSVVVVPPLPPQGEDPVQFADQNLKTCIEQALQFFDPTPSDMLELISLDGRHCQITNLEGIEYATNLQSLRFSFNKITDVSPLSDLINLNVLKVNDNQISSVSALSGLDNLWHLDVHNNQIQNISPLSGLPNLEVLVLRGNNITSISALSALDLLRHLYLQENELSGISPLSGLSELTDLKLDDNHISSISALSVLENLRFLGLSNNDISSISPLTSLTQLKSVDLRNNNLNSQAYDQDLQTLRDNNPGVSLKYDPQP